nr:dna replication complex gins protein sld5 [Quercus suber]
MDVDISDILASVSAPQLPQSTLDLQALTRAWINERASPALLPNPSDLVDRTMDRVKRQIESIEDMTGTMDPQANFTLNREGGFSVVFPGPEDQRQTVVAYVRDQIDKYPLHTRSLALSDPDFLSRLEQQYLQSHQALLSSHYHASFLSSFPSQLQKLDDTQGGVSMIDQPDEDTAVFCRVIRDAGTVEVYADTGSSVVDLTRGDVWLLRWNAIRAAVEKGDIELI